MCAICGVVKFNSEAVQKEEIIKMLEPMVHRGPDDEGVVLKQNVGFGHRRLSIIDLTSSGRQPMCNEDKTLWVVFNGEIYNYIELRSSLLKKGHTFSSQTDTEVIVHLYEDEGVQCLQKLRGMFAFAFWDEKNKTLFIARDRAGKKPLFYTKNELMFAFASEIKALLTLPQIKKEPSFMGIDTFLSLGYVPSPHTAFENIFKLPPAHYLLLKPDGTMEITRYWSLHNKENHKEVGALPQTEMQEMLLLLLDEAVRLRLRSDVPLGVFLSGGIDSSIITYFAAQHTSKLKTFTVGFPVMQYDEREPARKVAQYFDAEHCELEISPNIRELLHSLVWHYEEPFGDSSAIPSFYISQAASRHVKVILNGDGGDELFAGYDRYRAMKLWSYFHSLKGCPALLSLLSSVTPHGNFKSFGNNLYRFSQLLRQGKSSLAYFFLLNAFSCDEKRKLYNGELKERFNETNASKVCEETFEFYTQSCPELLQKLLSFDTFLYLPEDLLRKMDVATMAYSLEGRSPMLDHYLMEFAFQITSSQKLHFLTTKYILRKLFKDKLPEGITQRKKAGFKIPLDEWLRKELKDNLLSLETGALVKNGILNKDPIRIWIKEHLERKNNHEFKLWYLLMLTMWWEEFLSK